MKKIFLIILTAFLAVTLLSCGQNGNSSENPNPEIEDKPIEDSGDENKDDVNDENSDSNTEQEKVSYGTDGAKYLLAQNRLNQSVLSGSAGIFKGEKVLSNLAGKIKMSNIILNNAKKTVKISDTSVEWDADQNDYSNSMSYFLNLTTNVEDTAKRGAELIRHVKKNIKVINVWVVESKTLSYLLEVDKNSETIYEKNSAQTFICRRYANEKGQDVYELYFNNVDSQTRMKYIEGNLVEYFHLNQANDFNHHFMAENTKGYWDVFGWLNGSHYNATIIKDDIVYDYLGTAGDTDTGILDIISNDRKNDVITISDLNKIEIYPTAFEGFDKLVVEIESPDDISTSNKNGNYKIEVIDGTYNVFGNVDVNIVLDDGTVLKPGQLTDKVNYRSTMIQYRFGDEVYFNSIKFEIKGDTIAEVLGNLKEFLEQYNIQCKYDLDEIIENVINAQDEIKSNALYKMWNGVVINSEEKILEAADLEIAKYEIYKEMLKETEDYEKINFAQQDIVYTYAAFAEIESSSKDKVEFDGEKIIINNLTFTVTNTVLLDKLETYSVGFGMVKKGNESNVIILPSNLDSFTYDGSDSYTISFSGEVDIPELDFGEYIPVFYLSTSDGIMISLVEPLIFDEVIDVSYKDDNRIVTITKNDNNYLFMKIERNLEINFEHIANEELSYEDLMLLLGSTANVYGIILPESVIEVYNQETQEYVEFALNSEIISGKYRISYRVYIEEEYQDSYVFLDLLIDIIEEEPTIEVS